MTTIIIRSFLIRLTVIFIFFVSQTSFSQQSAYFILGEKEFEGVQIYDVIQDNENNYWFATDQGFFKYDNYTFEQVSCIGMKGTSAFGFVKDKFGKIYCYNLNKQIIKIENNNCSVFYEIKEEDFSNDLHLQITSENELMVVTKTIFIIDKKGKKKSIKQPAFRYYGFPFQFKNGMIISHLADKDSILVFDNNQFSVSAIKVNDNPIKGVLKFFESDGSVYAVSTDNKQFYIYKPEKNELIPYIRFKVWDEKEFFRFYEVDGSLWAAGTLSGVYHFSQGASFDIDGKFYKDYLISDVFKDNEGNLLLSTFNFGVLVIPSLAIPDVLPFEGIKNAVSIEFDNELGILCGTLKGELWQIDSSGNKVINAGGSRPVQSVFSFSEFPYIIYDDGKLKALHRKTGKNIELANVSLKDAVMHSDGNIYLSLNKGIGKISNIKGKLSFDRIEGINLRTYAIENDLDSNLYIASSEGLKKITINGEILDMYFESMPVFVNDIFTEGKITYAASKENGILKIEDGKITGKILPKWKDPSNEILKLIIHDSFYYVLTSKGFLILNHDGEILSQLNKLHGFSTQRIFDFQIYPSKQNGRNDLDEIWLVHSKGIHRIRISLLFVDVKKPKIQLSSFFVNDPKVDTEKWNSFDFNSRDFRFVFSSPTLKNKENISYHYILEGYDTEWQIKDYFSNEVSYNALAPGTYTFRLKAENQGVFSDEIKYEFTIKSPFYYSWWFILLVTGGIVAVLILFFRRKLRNQKRKAEILNEMNASRLAAIQSQMNPHFIFNSMNAIQDLVLKGDIDNSYTYITKFSDLVRRTLDYSGKDFIGFEQELKLIELYLSLEKLRFKDQLQIEMDKPEFEDILVPPMLIQPFIENALVHGLLHRAGEKWLKINFQIGKELICVIEDNGVGREKAREIRERKRAGHESFSGEAIKKRFAILKQQYGGELGFGYEDLIHNGEPIGTRVTLRIPYKRNF